MPNSAQLAKKRHLAAKLLTGPGDRVLDIGSGWGGLGLYLAEMTGATVSGVTLSTEQLQVSNARAAEKNLTRSAQFVLKDYRDIPGPFDRIISVGMFEHVGVDFYEAFFRRCAELLTDDGVMVLHSIGRSDGPDVTNPWIAKYIHALASPERFLAPPATPRSRCRCARRSFKDAKNLYGGRRRDP